MTDAPLLEVQDLTKRFGGLVAVKGLGFAIRGGEVLGLIGPNGSGKSTAMRCVMGVDPPTSGSVRFEGREVAGLPAHKIARLGVGLVFQHSRPLNRQTVLENIKVALIPDRLSMILHSEEIDAKARAIAQRVGLGAVLDRKPPTLAFADLRRMELAKALAQHPKLVLVDEPFAGLTSSEVGAFSELISEFRSEGRAVLLVDHNVKSVAALVDRAVAMYLGEKIAEGTAAEVMRDETVRRVYLGGALTRAQHEPARVAQDGPPLLEVDGVEVRYGKALAVQGVSLQVREGEFVALVGLNGAGKTTLFNAISGLVRHAGSIRWNGHSLAGMTPAAIARAGIVQCPETRELFGDMTVRENLELGGNLLSPTDLAERMAWLFDLFPILRDRSAQVARTLSGGEQQMLAIARALMMKPRLLILDEPTLGLAPVILETLSKALHRLRSTTGLTVLLGEQNITFALPHADRLYVVEHGRIAWEGEPERFEEEAAEAYL
ncbi:ATP-binding cassette domain-containing protein [Ramlibacter sp. G-1-2-2]|uniref:ATP-binding cassette domain-containing protein n=1 Tax=Ramlibacter agri TaxID=2728837 RepID=A0A848H980_9BURK|nr:ATP-binding cassette domain-containing protein [Ramlibacter agri]